MLGNEAWKTRVYTLTLCKTQKGQYIYVFVRVIQTIIVVPICKITSGCSFYRVTSRNVKAKSFWYDVAKVTKFFSQVSGRFIIVFLWLRGNNHKDHCLTDTDTLIIWMRAICLQDEDFRLTNQLGLEQGRQGLEFLFHLYHQSFHILTEQL